jgi:hypothetical protein
LGFSDLKIPASFYFILNASRFIRRSFGWELVVCLWYSEPFRACFQKALGTAPALGRNSWPGRLGPPSQRILRANPNAFFFLKMGILKTPPGYLPG